MATDKKKGKVKDLKPRKGAASKVKGGMIPPRSPLDQVREKVQKILPR